MNTTVRDIERRLIKVEHMARPPKRSVVILDHPDDPIPDDCADGCVIIIDDIPDR